MTTFKKLVTGLTALTMLAAGLTGCAGSTEESSTPNAGAASSANNDAASSEEKIDVRISYWDYNVQGLIFKFAQDWGIMDEVFSEYPNVNIELIPFENGPTANEAITAGDLDFELAIGDQPFLTGNANGVDTVAVAVTMKQEKSYITVVGADSDINSYADLSGKNIAVGVGTFTHKSLIGILDENNISINDVAITNIGDAGYQEALTAISRGEIDAYLGPWFSLNASVVSGEVKDIGDLTGHALYNYFVGTNAFVSAHPDITEKLVEVLYKTENYLVENIDTQAEYIGGLLDTDPQTIKGLVERADIEVRFEDADIQSILDTQDFLINQDILTEKIADLEENHINTSFVKKVTGEN